MICYIATLVSFMLEDLAKLVIFTGGFLPISYMRNDTVNNIIECFSIISLAESTHLHTETSMMSSLYVKTRAIGPIGVLRAKRGNSTQSDRPTWSLLCLSISSSVDFNRYRVPVSFVFALPTNSVQCFYRYFRPRIYPQVPHSTKPQKSCL